MTAADWNIACDWFDSFRFVFSVLAATWIFARGSATRRTRYGLWLSIIMAVGTLLAIANPLYVGLGGGRLVVLAQPVQFRADLDCHGVPVGIGGDQTVPPYIVDECDVTLDDGFVRGTIHHVIRA